MNSNLPPSAATGLVKPVMTESRAPSIGGILIDAKRLDPARAELILREQKTSNLRFGEAAIKLGLLTRSDIDFALSQQYKYSYLQAGDASISTEVVAAFQPFSEVVEQIRVLRTQLMLRWFTDDSGGVKGKSLAVIGAGRGEGRSYMAANLAVVCSQLGEKTLLIDADMRNPRQHELFKLKGDIGLSTMLAGRAGAEAIRTVPGLANLSILPAGPLPPNPQELIGSGAFSQILGEAYSKFDVVLIDTPAADTAADFQVICAQTGGALLLIHKDSSSAPALQKCTAELQRVGVNVVGAVLTEH